MGINMAIDEKQIGEEMHTILSNRDTGKIALLASSVNATDLQRIIIKVSDKTDKIETVTRDMSASYTKFCSENFFNASHIADKFHIIKSLLDACQAVRVRYRQDALREKRLAYQDYKQQEKEKKKICNQQGLPYTRSNFTYPEEVLTNDESVLEALARSRYLLYKFKNDWTSKQEIRARALFTKYPEIETAYNLACDFRNWMKIANKNKEMSYLKKIVISWFDEVEKSGIDEILNFKSMIERDILAVFNYFKFGATNAIAENINSRIQRFIMINQGTRDRDFFYFRVNNYFA
jgi:transposase